MTNSPLPRSLELKDRTLWFDGQSSMYSDRIANILLSGKSIEGIHPIEIDSSVKKFNLYADKSLSIKEDIGELDKSYTIPDLYLNIHLKHYIFERLATIIERDNIHDENDIRARISRINQELKLFHAYDMENLIRTAIFMVDKFEEHSIVWGTGRGSSCACYSLYVIGLHEVDSVKYDLDLTEFFR